MLMLKINFKNKKNIILIYFFKKLLSRYKNYIQNNQVFLINP
jgi:hypothetical protein